MNIKSWKEQVERAEEAGGVARGLISRKTHQRLMDDVNLHHKDLLAMGGNRLSSLGCWEFPGGHTLRTRVITESDDFRKVAGLSFNWLDTDYLNHYLRSYLRDPDSVPCVCNGVKDE